MSRKLTKALYLVNFIFTILCFLHVSITLYTTFNPPLPDIKTFDRALKDTPFPILFKLCGKKIHGSSTRFKTLGYKNGENFWKGVNRFYQNKTIVGWNGHTKNGSTVATVKGIQSSHLKSGSY